MTRRTGEFGCYLILLLAFSDHWLRLLVAGCWIQSVGMISQLMNSWWFFCRLFFYQQIGFFSLQPGVDLVGFCSFSLLLHRFCELNICHVISFWFFPIYFVLTCGFSPSVCGSLPISYLLKKNHFLTLLVLLFEDKENTLTNTFFHHLFISKLEKCKYYWNILWTYINQITFNFGSELIRCQKLIKTNCLNPNYSNYCCYWAYCAYWAYALLIGGYCYVSLCV